MSCSLCFFRLSSPSFRRDPMANGWDTRGSRRSSVLFSDAPFQMRPSRNCNSDLIDKVYSKLSSNRRSKHILEDIVIKKCPQAHGGQKRSGMQGRGVLRKTVWSTTPKPYTVNFWRHSFMKICLGQKVALVTIFLSFASFGFAYRWQLGFVYHCLSIRIYGTERGASRHPPPTPLEGSEFSHALKTPSNRLPNK